MHLQRNTIMPKIDPPIFQAFVAPGLLSPTDLTSLPLYNLVRITENGIDPNVKANSEYANNSIYNLISLFL